MFRQSWVVAAVVAIVLANTGCVSCCHKTYQRTWNSGPECDLPTPCRDNVYVFLIHGLTPSTECGLDTLRTKLAENGFAKVGVAELGSGLCIESEIKSIRGCDPDARFVLVGYDLGASSAVCLARGLTSKGVPVEAVVLLDPLGCSSPSGLQTLLITGGKTTSTVPHTDRVVVPGVTHFNLPAHPTTVTAITSLLHEIASRNCEPAVDPVPEWGYKHAPEMRPIAELKGDGWDFLVDQGAPQAIGTRVTATRPLTSPAPASPPNAAGPVVIKR